MGGDRTRTEHSSRISNASALTPQYQTLKRHKKTVTGVLNGSKDVGFTKHELCGKKNTSPRNSVINTAC